MFRNLFAGEQNRPVPVTGSRRRRLTVGEPHPIVYAVGDVHGCIGELRRAERRIAEDATEPDRAKLVVLLGDYVDRGPESAAVIEYLCQRSPLDLERICLCGNHDDAMAQFVRDPDANMSWLSLGGAATLKSYGIDPGQLRKARRAHQRELLDKAVPQRHLEFLDSLPVCLRMGSVLFVHAGVDPARTLEEQTDHDMMWIREPFITNGPGIPMTVVHGHTPSVDITTGPGRIGIDTAACVTGKLSVLKVQDGAFTLL